MKHLLLFGAGKSATVLIGYLKQLATDKHWQVIIADASEQALLAKIGDHPLVKPAVLRIENEAQRQSLVAAADIVISLLPPALHVLVARDCLAAGKNLLTASYVSDDIRAMQKDINAKKLLFLCEMGLDPGIDHMSAMQLIHRITDQGGEITSFQSHCGGLVAPESDNNPWHYKISWNPRNVVLAGKAGAVYKKDGVVVQQHYEELFGHCATIEVPGLAALAYYPNRDSLQYAGLYQLDNAATFMRTTLRYPAFCTGWQQVIELGLTDEATLYNTNGISYHQFFMQLLAARGLEKSRYALQQCDDAVVQQLQFLGLYNRATLVNKGTCSAADVLQTLLETKLSLQPNDKDMIVMVHELEYLLQSQRRKTTATLVVKGRNSSDTAMATTVGLPLGIAAKLILEEHITVTGLHVPVLPEIYEPVLAALQELGVAFTEETI
ncbi:saccharopine dehydrogenase C-terminal domain-containing protein [Deminuibacter soli]|uniref:Saccharopine dehydrogenase n=1 Tax=Deminuibacter soli TaxID=2291815 RepID=A0A3E1NJI7_9BACT|nr:saccharopine dehydrogenase C-terminal domain-containing protein [Deminuibacter soli]RFM28093.1 saccharopine dehydrogenase [Deminuibacter soli]